MASERNRPASPKPLPEGAAGRPKRSRRAAHADELVRKGSRESHEQTRRHPGGLRRINEALAAERKHLYAVLDQLPAFVCLLKPDCTLQFANRRFVELFGEARGHMCFETMAGREEPCETCNILRVLEEKTAAEWEWTSPAGRTYQIYDYPFDGPVGPPMVLKLGIDITERTRMAEKLQRNEEEYRILVEGMNEGLGVIDMDQVFKYVNGRLCAMLGYPSDEIIGRPVAHFVDDSYRSLLAEQRRLRSHGEHQPYELVWTRKDGGKVAAIISPQPIYGPEGRFKGSLALITDITERKRAEKALRESERQLQSLSAQLLRAQETERARVSRELHDGLGQALTTMKLRLALLRKKLPVNRASLKKDCDEALGYVEEVIEDVRRLSRDLSPQVLEDLGLVAALRRLVNDFARHSNARVSFQIGKIGGLLSRDGEIILYRILQEAITNIGRHARAAQASVHIEKQGGSVLCNVDDDGKGFDVDQVLGTDHADHGMGIRIMKERVRMLGGSLDLRSEPGEGTHLAILIPIGGGRM
jgi:PAS domain S-box-containing protein